jgi:hypothetical protein
MAIADPVVKRLMEQSGCSQGAAILTKEAINKKSAMQHKQAAADFAIQTVETDGLFFTGGGHNTLFGLVPEDTKEKEFKENILEDLYDVAKRSQFRFDTIYDFRIYCDMWVYKNLPEDLKPVAQLANAFKKERQFLVKKRI